MTKLETMLSKGPMEVVYKGISGPNEVLETVSGSINFLVPVHELPKLEIGKKYTVAYEGIGGTKKLVFRED